MKLNVLVVATQEWKTRELKHAQAGVLINLNQAFESVTFTTVHKKLVPQVHEGRIDGNWFEEHLSKEAKSAGFNHVIFSFSIAEGKKWNIDSGVRGVNYRDSDYFGESWVCSDENSTIKYAGTSRVRYVKTVAHEIAHELKNKGLTDLEIHDYDQFSRQNIEGFYQELVLKKKSVGWLISLIRNLIYERSMYQLPLPNHWSKVSQGYGVPNAAWYPRTGRHIGTDFPTPVGTPFLAPKKCEVYSVGNSKSTGYWMSVKIDNWYMYVCHLQKMAVKGQYKQGEVLAYTGNTGQTTGPHAHVEGWTVPVDRSKLNKSSWHTLTFDVTTKIK